jgi:hypothetical protein
MKKICFLLLIPFLTHCSSTGSSSGKLPILSSPARAQAWGAPKVSQTGNSYEATYVNPANSKERLTVTGSSQMMPFFVYPPNIKGTKIVNGIATQVREPQLWTKALVNGKPARWYQSSFPTAQEAAKFRTMGVHLKDQSGGSGTYRIEATGTKNQMRTWLTELRLEE